MDRLTILLVAIAGTGALWLVWRGIKLWLRHSIRVDQGTLNDDKPTLLYFSSPDCAPCHLQQSPILASLHETLGDCVSFQEYDAVAHPDLARRYRVLTVPTTVVVTPHGEVVAVNYGVTQAEKLQRQLEMAADEREDALTPCVA